MIGGEVYLGGKGKMRLYLLRSWEVVKGGEVVRIFKDKIGNLVFKWWIGLII